jgi:hypothetical protein
MHAAAFPNLQPQSQAHTFAPMIVDPTTPPNAFGPAIPPAVLQFPDVGHSRQKVPNVEQQATKKGRKGNK